MVYIGQWAAQLITGYVRSVCFFMFIPPLWEVCAPSLLKYLFGSLAFSPPVPSLKLCSLSFTHLWQSADPKWVQPGGEGQNTRGDQRSLYLMQECRKCGNNWGVRAWAFSLLRRWQRVFSPGENRRRQGQLIATVGLEKEKEHTAPLTGLQFEDRQAAYTMQTPPSHVECQEWR